MPSATRRTLVPFGSVAVRPSSIYTVVSAAVTRTVRLSEETSRYSSVRYSGVSVGSAVGSSVGFSVGSITGARISKSAASA